MVVINVYSRFNGEFESMFDGYDDEETSLNTLSDVENSFRRAKEIKNLDYKLVADQLVEDMKDLLKQLAENGGSEQ